MIRLAKIAKTMAFDRGKKFLRSYKEATKSTARVPKKRENIW